jgi:quercetin dioxygenase-like cupin family protein
MDKKIEKGIALNINELIDYAEGGIVSKEFEHTKGGSITLFAFDKGQKLSEHTAPFDAVIQIVDGEADVMIADKWHHPKSGEMIIIPKDTLHALNAGSRFKMMLTMIKG